MPRYRIHIGPHKTATTYIQSRLAAAQDSLREVGVLYPVTWRASEVLAGHQKLFARIRRRELSALEREISELPVEPDGLVILSSEDLQALTEEEVGILAEALGARDVMIVYYCRRWSDLLPSIWQERTKHGDDQPLAESLLFMLSRINSFFASNYGLVLDRYLKIFGPANVRIVSYNNVVDQQTDIAEHFVATFLPPLPGSLPPPKHPRANTSLAPAEIEMVRVLNAVHRLAGGVPSSAVRLWFEDYGRKLDRSAVTAAMNAATATMPFSDTIPVLELLHQHLYRRYRHLLVPPLSADRLFQPRQRELAFVRQDYLADPVVAMQVQELYRRFRAA